MLRKIGATYRQAYRGLPRGAWILFTVNLVNSSGTMVFFFLSLYLTLKLGFSPARAGQALSLYGAGMLGGAHLGGWLADRIGSIAVQKASLALSGILLIALGSVRAPWGIFPLLFLLALAAGMLYPANATSMALVCPPDLQVKGFALNRLANNLGATLGPAVGGFLALHDYRLLFWGDGLTSLLAAAVFSWLWKGAGAGIHAIQTGMPSNQPDRSPWRDGPFLLLMLVFLVWSIVFIQILTTFPLYLRGVYGLAENRIGQLFAVNTIIIVVLEMVLMEKIRKYPLVHLINLSFLLVGAGLGLMPLGRGFGFAAVTVAIWTVGEMLSIPLVTALVASRAGSSSQGQYMGMFSFGFSLAFIIAPAAGTAVYGRFGGAALWFSCAAVCLILAIAFALLRPAFEAGMAPAP